MYRFFRFTTGVFVCMILGACQMPVPPVNSTPATEAADAHPPMTPFSADRVEEPGEASSHPTPTASAQETSPSAADQPAYPAIDLDQAFSYLQDGGALPEGALARIGVGNIRGVEALADGPRLLLETDSGLYVYDTDTFERIWRRYPDRYPRSYALSPDKTRLAVGSWWDHSPILFDMATGNRVKELPGWYEAYWSPESDLVAVQEQPADPDRSTIGRISLYDGVSGALEHTLEAPITGYYGPVFSSVHWSPDGQHIAACSDDGLFVWKVSTASRIREIGVEDVPGTGYDRLLCVGFSESEPYYLAEAHGPDKWTYIATSLDTGAAIPVILPVRPAESMPAEFVLPDGDTLHIIDDGRLDSLGALRYSPDGRWVADRPGASNLDVWDRATREMVYTIPGSVSFISWSPAAKWLVVWSWAQEGQYPTLYDAQTGQQRFASLPPSSIVVFLDERYLVITDDPRIFIFDLVSEEVTGGARLNLPPRAIGWSKDGEYLCIRTTDHEGWRWSASSGIVEEGPCTDVDFTPVNGFDYRNPDPELVSPDGALRAVINNFTGCGDGPAGGGCGIWGGFFRVFEGDTLIFEKGGEGFLGSGGSALGWSSDSQMLAIAQTYAVDTLASDAILVINPRTGKELLHLQGHVQPITTLLFSPDGARLASCSQDGTIIVWGTAH